MHTLQVLFAFHRSNRQIRTLKCKIQHTVMIKRSVFKNMCTVVKNVILCSILNDVHLLCLDIKYVYIRITVKILCVYYTNGSPERVFN